MTRRVSLSNFDSAVGDAKRDAGLSEGGEWMDRHGLETGLGPCCESQRQYDKATF